jgi:hypothetical protein
MNFDKLDHQSSHSQHQPKINPTTQTRHVVLPKKTKPQESLPIHQSTPLPEIFIEDHEELQSDNLIMPQATLSNPQPHTSLPQEIDTVPTPHKISFPTLPVAIIVTLLIAGSAFFLTYTQKSLVTQDPKTKQTPSSMAGNTLSTVPIASTSAEISPEVFAEEPAKVCEVQLTVGQLACYQGECSADTDCAKDSNNVQLVCKSITQNGTAHKYCVNANCTDQSSCVCPTPPPTPEIKGCYDTCSDSFQCSGSLRCQSVNGTQRCVNQNCQNESSCVCPSPTPTPTPQKGCYEQCDNNSQCSNSQQCITVNGTNMCANPTCPNENDCSCPPIEAPQAPELPKAGGLPPTLLFTIGGIALVAIGLLF